VSGFQNILAIDTATNRLVLAASYGEDRLVKSDTVVEKSHGQVLLKKIEELLESSSMTPADLEGIVVSLGPGSFTGLRIGLAAAKGIAVASSTPLTGISMFELADYSLRDREDLVWVVIPSRKGEWYAVERRAGVIDIESARILSDDALLTELGDNPVYSIGVEIRKEMALKLRSVPEKKTPFWVSWITTEQTCSSSDGKD